MASLLLLNVRDEEWGLWDKGKRRKDEEEKRERMK